MKRQSSFTRRIHANLVRAFKLQEIKEATNNFSSDTLLGEGGFGWVYKGVSTSGEMWAVKRSKNPSATSLEEFEKEVGTKRVPSSF